MLSHLLPLLAISGAVASPLRPERRQDASAIVSSASAAVSGAGSQVSSAASVAPSIATSATTYSAPSAMTSATSYSAPPADPSAPPSESTSASAPSVTMYPDTSAGEPIVVNGAQGLVPGVDTYLGVPFAAPRKSHLLDRNRLTIQLSVICDWHHLNPRSTTRATMRLHSLLRVFRAHPHFLETTTAKTVFT